MTLLDTLLRRYASEGVPRVEQQHRDLLAVAAEADRERTKALIRAVNGYARSQREERRLRRWGGKLPCLLREQAE